MFVSHEQNARQYRNIRTDYKSFERVDQFQHFGKNIPINIAFMKK